MHGLPRSRDLRRWESGRRFGSGVLPAPSRRAPVQLVTEDDVLGPRSYRCVEMYLEAACLLSCTNLVKALPRWMVSVA